MTKTSLNRRNFSSDNSASSPSPSFLNRCLRFESLERRDLLSFGGLDNPILHEASFDATNTSYACVSSQSFSSMIDAIEISFQNSFQPLIQSACTEHEHLDRIESMLKASESTVFLESDEILGPRQAFSKDEAPLFPAFSSAGKSYYSLEDFIAIKESLARPIVFVAYGSDETSLSEEFYPLWFSDESSTGRSSTESLRNSGGGSSGGEFYNLVVESSLTSASGVSANVENGLLEQQVGTIVNNTLFDADYLTVTFPEIPYPYEAPITIFGTASLGSDYQVFFSSPGNLSILDGGTSGTSLTYSGGSSTFIIRPVNDSCPESLETVTATLGQPFLSGSGGIDDFASFTIQNATVSASFVDDDHWLVSSEATDPIARERLPNLLQDKGILTFTRTHLDPSIPGDVSYGVKVSFDLVYNPDSAYCYAIPDVDYLFSTTPSSDESETFLSNFHRSLTPISQTEEGDLIYHCEGWIPAGENSASLKIEPIFDWLDEGELFNPESSDDPEVQRGERVLVRFTSADWIGRGAWLAVNEPSEMEVEIKDGAILEEYLDYDGDGQFDIEESIVDLLCRVAHNRDDDNLNEVPDFEDGYVSGENDLTTARLYVWVEMLTGSNENPDYYFDVYQGVPTRDTSACVYWLDPEKEEPLESTPLGSNRFYVGRLAPTSNVVTFDYYVEGVADGNSTLFATANCYQIHHHDEGVSVPAYDVTEETLLRVYGLSVDIDIDSDNNGYVNDPDKNGERAQAEDAIETLIGKPITCYPLNTSIDVTTITDYVYVPMRVNVDLGAYRDSEIEIYYRFESSPNLKIYRKTSNEYIEILTGENSLLSENPLDSDYYIRAIDVDSSSVGMLDAVHLVLLKQNAESPVSEYEEMTRDTVLFSIQDSSLLTGWTIPSGWRIGEDGSLTTPTPVHGAVGPKNEGSLVVNDSNNELTKRGDAFYKLSNDQIQNGFTLSMDVEFLRNTSSLGDGIAYHTGYLRPDCGTGENPTRGDEKINVDLCKMGFFGNSGVKFKTNDWLEVQIFDVGAWRNALCVTAQDLNSGMITPIIMDHDGVRVISSGHTIVYPEEAFQNLLTGTPYFKGSQGTVPHNDWDNSINLLNSSSVHLIIKVVNISGSDNFQIHVYYRNEDNEEFEVYNELWSNEEYYLTKQQLIANPYVFLQSHWGSGVCFRNITIASP